MKELRSRKAAVPQAMSSGEAVRHLVVGHLAYCSLCSLTFLFPDFSTTWCDTITMRQLGYRMAAVSWMFCPWCVSLVAPVFSLIIS